MKPDDINPIPIHHKCRNCGKKCEKSTKVNMCSNEIYVQKDKTEKTPIKRFIVPDEKVRWSTSFKYHPQDFTSNKIQLANRDYVDQDPSKRKILWNSVDKTCDRRSYHGRYRIVNHRPQNPCGRTGLTGRGHLGTIFIEFDLCIFCLHTVFVVLGHFGPNHAVDPIVTRWKRGKDKIIIRHPTTKKRVMQFVCKRRKDTQECAYTRGYGRKARESD
jgi:ADP-ribose pyrophosphatase